MKKREPKTPRSEDTPPPSAEKESSSSAQKKSSTEEIEVYSRVHRPLVFNVRGGGTVRLAAFETVKLPAFALEAPEVQTLLTEGAIVVIGPQKAPGRHRREGDS